MRQAAFRRISDLPAIARTILAASMAVAVMLAASQAHASKYASIVVDANTGKTLHASSADAARFPASLTKMMTLYMVFEAMQAGRITKDTRIKFSAQASAKPPTKLGVRAGGSITVETAIYALVTKSANDAAAAVAEHLGGSEANFARMMTAKARRLGMNSTTFRNASGLPDSAQKTTARDMATLGIALREHFPKQYGYFSTRSFTFGKSRMANHNKLLGRVKGVDGIKTGYTRASGFNLVSSVKVDGKSIVAVVMGGQSGRSRDAHMAELIRENLGKASRRDTGPVVAKKVIQEYETPVAAAVVTLPRKGAPTPDQRPETVSTKVEALALVEAPEPPAAIDPVSTASTASAAPSGAWVVQVASSPSETEARAVLSRTTERAGRILSDASPYTVPFEKDGTVYHRARFHGFSTKTAAWNACSALKKKKIECYAVQQ